MVTRAADRAASTLSALEALGATALSLPTIEIIPPGSWADLDAALDQIGTYHWLLLTSANAFRHLTSRMQQRGIPVARALTPMSIACVGRSTARVIADAGLPCDLVPQVSDAAHMATELVARGVSERRFLLPQAAGGRTVLQEGLREAGAIVDVVEVYRTQCPTTPDRAVVDEVAARGADAVLFASPSAVSGFASLLGRDRTLALLNQVTVVAIGTVTAGALEELGVTPDIVPPRASANAMVEALGQFAEASQRR